LPEWPNNPDQLNLLTLKHLPRHRKSFGNFGCKAILNAMFAHVELNTIDLILNMAGHYVADDLHFYFVSYWLSVPNEEANILCC